MTQRPNTTCGRDGFNLLNVRVGRIIAALMVGFALGLSAKDLTKFETSFLTICDGSIVSPDVSTLSGVSVKLLAHPSNIIPVLERRYDWLDTISVLSESSSTSIERARFAYLELLRSIVSATAYGNAEKTVMPKVNTTTATVKDLNMTMRQHGYDWTYLGYTMTGFDRLNKLRELWIDVFSDNIPGDFIETGVWRGGSSIYAKGILEAYNQRNRHIYVCDSFSGLPPGDVSFDYRDVGWDNTPYLEVSEGRVKDHFEEANLLDEKVHFVKGFFNESMPILRSSLPPDQKFAIMRLDGDLYQSTVDVLYTLYDRLSVGGYLIMDDWNGFPSKTACEDFFRVHNFTPIIIEIDDISAYWEKTEDIDLQYWRYEKKEFT